jgi:all-trans-retinol dehydrogenase (NAD+)
MYFTYLTTLTNLLYAIVLIIYSSLICLVKQLVPYRYRAKNINGEIALVTGSGSGIGRLIAIKLAKLGVKLALVDIDKANNEKTANEILMNGGYAKTFTCDLSSREAIYKMAEEVNLVVNIKNITLVHFENCII